MVNCKDCFVPVINVIIFITLTMILILNIFEMYKEQYRVDFLKMMLTNWKTSPATKIYIPTEPISNNDDSLINVGIFAGAEDGCRCINEKYNRKDGIITKYFYYNLTEKDASGNIKCNNKGCERMNGKEEFILNKWQNKEIVIIRMNPTYNYFYFLDNLSEDGKSCKDETYKQCAILDTLNQPMCVKQDEDCPINDILIKEGQEHLDNYDIIPLDNNKSIYYTNKINDSKIIIDFQISNGQPCAEPYEQNLNKNLDIYPLMKNQSIYRCKVAINENLTDDRFRELDSQNLSHFYRDNDISALSKFYDDYSEDKMKLYGVEYYGLDKKKITEAKINITSFNFILDLAEVYTNVKMPFKLNLIFVSVNLILIVIYFIIFLFKQEELLQKFNSKTWGLTTLLSIFTSFLLISFIFDFCWVRNKFDDPGDYLLNDKLRESYKVYRRWSISNILMFCLGFFGGLLGIIRSQISMKYNIKLNEAQPLIEEKQKTTTKSSIFFLQRSSIMSKSEYSNVLSMDSLGDNYF